jgi:hypothetical protein
MDEYSVGEILKIDPVPKKLPRDPKGSPGLQNDAKVGGPGLQNDAKVLPEGAKMETQHLFYLILTSQRPVPALRTKCIWFPGF